MHCLDAFFVQKKKDKKKGELVFILFSKKLTFGKLREARKILESK